MSPYREPAVLEAAPAPPPWWVLLVGALVVLVEHAATGREPRALTVSLGSRSWFLARPRGFLALAVGVLGSRCALESVAEAARLAHGSGAPSRVKKARAR